jgi:6,7-dimethyl-8-ribityllumazine synthase
VVASRWNGPIVERLLEGCTRRLQELGAGFEVHRVPGAFELPTAAKWLAEDDGNAAVICLGCVIRGETPHFEYVAGECARGVMRVSLDSGVPVIFGVLTVETEQQAIARTGEGHGHAGVAAADAAGEMILLRVQIRGDGA